MYIVCGSDRTVSQCLIWACLINYFWCCVSYPGAIAGCILLVRLVLCPLVQFGPQSLDLPWADGGLQRAVEVGVVQRVQLQLPAQNTESLECAFAGSCLDKCLKEPTGLCHALIFSFTHQPWGAPAHSAGPAAQLWTAITLCISTKKRRKKKGETFRNKIYAV